MRYTALKALKRLAILGLALSLLTGFGAALAEEEASPAAPAESIPANIPAIVETPVIPTENLQIIAEEASSESPEGGATEAPRETPKEAPKETPKEAPKALSKKQIKTIALQEAGVKSSAVTKWVKLKRDGDEWDVEFKTKQYIFDMDIDAYSGAVSDFERVEIKVKISKNKAKSVALERAGVKSSAVAKWIKLALDGDEWKAEFRTSTMTYAIAIDAYSAEVTSYEAKEIVREPLSESKAKSAALKKAGIKSSAVKKWSKVQLDKDEWDIEFQTSTYKYDVEIDAYSGKVKSFEKNALPKDPLTEAQAKSTALKKAGIKSSAVKRWIKVQLDKDEWDIEFQTDKYRFEVEINALTGKVKDFERKALPSEVVASISLVDAKEIALNHAKGKMLITGKVKYTKAKLEREEGAPIYEIEFRYNNYEFDYEIDANSGDILDWDMEWDG